MAEHLDLLEKQGRLEEYLREAMQDDALVAQISYWEKWYTPEQQKLIDEIVHERFERESVDWELPLGLEKKFTEDKLRLIFSNMMFLQLSFGCSKGCPLCGADAVRGVRDTTKTGQIEKLYQKYGEELSKARPVQYYASEQKDHPDHEKIYGFAEKYAGYSPLITTANFSGEEWKAFLNAHADRTRLSLWGIENPELITREIQAGDFEGRGKEQEKGMGVSRRDLNHRPEENGVFDGLNHFRTAVIVTPRGLYNSAPVAPSDRFPQANIISPIEEIKSTNELLESQNPDLQEILRHGVAQINRRQDNLLNALIAISIKKRHSGERDFPPYSLLLNSSDGQIIIFYDIDGTVKFVTHYNQENLGTLVHADNCSDLFTWNHEGLTEKEVFEIEVHIMDERNQKVLEPTKKQEGMIGWELEMPGIGPVVIVLIEAKNKKGQQQIIVRKKSDIGKMTEQQIDEKPN